ncbi:hypothetical protein SEA_SWEETS_30 [Mycobacterium phage Sweets]|nr:hypothetical protein KDW72_gp30 [Mycobacterium phage Grizzly]AGK86211.1 hypothetical protein DNAIII_0030 [Mycobacterium phage DNAIII]ALF00722.1 hypothetical protein SEA_CEDASITE_30 [Mycobacterium phage Cedasite]AYD84082.1 hypothetical protein SEA_HOTSHOTBABY7_30 [Mycobacterium phage Hotshotbaby7]AYD84238.1 hypothetical protein SEA_KASEN3_30 [Mycobacterium phage Kasen3]AYD84551.1 hypothetical protein SEA_OLGA_30 [Mycobacterium phage Olga]AYD84683.1 hypothetical protein SEA_SWEETS_30 [Mycoba
MATVVVVAYVIWEIVGEAPQGMVTLVGLAGGALFGAVSGDKRKRVHDVELTAERAEAKADRAVAVVEDQDQKPAEPAGDDEGVAR